LLDLAEKAARLVNDKGLTEIVLLNAKVCAFKKNNAQAIEIMDSYLENNPRAYAVI